MQYASESRQDHGHAKARCHDKMFGIGFADCAGMFGETVSSENVLNKKISS